MRIKLDLCRDSDQDIRTLVNSDDLEYSSI